MNPIIRRELLDALRSRQAIALQLGLAAACAALVLVRWPTGETETIKGVPANQIVTIQQGMGVVDRIAFKR